MMYGLVFLGIIEFLNTILKQGGDFGDQGKIDLRKSMCQISVWEKCRGLDHKHGERWEVDFDMIYSAYAKYVLVFLCVLRWR